MEEKELEKELEKLIFTNMNFAVLDKEQTYAFRIKQDYIDHVNMEDLNKLFLLLKTHLDSLDLKYIVLAGDAIEVSTVKENK